ncbi:MAG: hypothetical protein PHR16_00675 [Methylovulum sp.]|nr:hypothetical protein [Methylovulum sp.]
MGSVRFQRRKICWRLLPSAARVRPVSAAARNSPTVRCAPLATPNDLTSCRDALHFVSALATARTPTKRPALRLRGGAPYTAPLTLRFLYSFKAGGNCPRSGRLQTRTRLAGCGDRAGATHTQQALALHWTNDRGSSSSSTSSGWAGANVVSKGRKLRAFF